MTARAPRDTPKRRLLSHIVDDHHRVPAKSMTTAELAAWHGSQHHRYGQGLAHYHDGPNRGADQRPPGWRTGEDVVWKRPAR